MSYYDKADVRLLTPDEVRRMVNTLNYTTESLWDGLDAQGCLDLIRAARQWAEIESFIDEDPQGRSTLERVRRESAARRTDATTVKEARAAAGRDALGLETELEIWRDQKDAER